MLIHKTLEWIKEELKDYKILLRSVPSLVMVLFVVSVISMNLLANKEIYTGLDWLSLDCGLILSWLSFLCMDMITKRFGAKASIKLSIVSVAVNLAVCLFLFIVSKIPGNWGQYYTFNSQDINTALNNTFGGTWYVLLGSTIAFTMSSVVNALINSSIGRMFKATTFKEYAVRSYISTFFAQFIDNLTFSLIVSHLFFGWTFLQCVTCSLTGCIVELMCEVIFSPLGFKMCKKWEQEGIGQNYLDYIESLGETK